jgi:hypothetical protein
MAYFLPVEPTPPDRPDPRPGKSRLARILAERPEARPRLARAVGSLLAVTLVTVAAIGVLVIWHLRRRAGLIRERLSSGRCNLSPAEYEIEVPEPDPGADGSDSPPTASR